MIQLDLFKDKEQVFIDEICATKNQLGALRRGAFARMDTINKRLDSLEKRLDQRENKKEDKVLQLPLFELFE